MAVFFRTAHVPDIPAMDGLNRSTLPENYDLYEWQAVLERSPGISMVAYQDSQLVGYCLAIVDPTTGKGQIASIAVLPAWRRQGIARFLLQKSLAKFAERNVQPVTLTVRVSNHAAQRLYDQLGFKRIHFLRHYYKDGEDANIMAKP